MGIPVVSWISRDPPNKLSLIILATQTDPGVQVSCVLHVPWIINYYVWNHRLPDQHDWVTFILGYYTIIYFIEYFFMLPIWEELPMLQSHLIGGNPPFWKRNSNSNHEQIRTMKLEGTRWNNNGPPIRCDTQLSQWPELMGQVTRVECFLAGKYVIMMVSLRARLTLTF